MTGPRPTALDELLRLTQGIDPVVVEQARQAAELMRRLNLLSTEPARAIRPFDRRTAAPPTTEPAAGWATARPIHFDRASS